MTDLYAVIGNPVGHSKSPQIHAEFARQTGQDMRYEAILAALDGFATAVEEFRARGGSGLNVTIPFKLEAFRLADAHTDRARRAGAVNTLKFNRDAILGDNTDGAGLVRDIEHNLGFPLAGRRVLLMGAGGAARGVLMPLLAETPLRLVIANRTVEKALDLAAAAQRHAPVAAEVRARVSAVPYSRLSGERFDIVINSTSSSLSGELPPLPGSVFAPASLAYDMMYGQDLTPFLEFAREHGAGHVADGIGMLVEQAAESFFLWRGVRPETARIIVMLRGEQ